ncbi:ATP-binding protein [Deinococcus sp. NW-56]|uniref:ATP-binding protein n=1 Tax=Deinococcus sp. NW-56 TaxID=2080419 RepID=UPI000CF36DFC|nr:ATP-binding protein [Deinococcus sp. NW-56]
MTGIILPFGPPQGDGEDAQGDNIYTYDGWRAFVNRPVPTPPPAMTRALYEALPREGRELYDETRRTYIMQFGPINTPMLDVAKQVIKEQVDANVRAPLDQVKTGVIIDGHANLGKTTMVKAIARQFERSIRARTSFAGPEAEHLFIPVVHVTLQRDTTPKAMAQAICHYLHVPLRGRETEHQLVQAIHEAVRRHRILLFVVDDIHFLRVRSKSGQETSNFLKSLMSLTGATFVYVGVGVEELGILQEHGPTLATSQTASRFIHLPIPPFEKGSDAWTRLLRAVEGHLALLDQEPGTLEKHAALLFGRSGGSVGPLMNLLRKAALQAVGGQERIGAQALRQARMDYKSMMDGSLEEGGSE